MQELRAQGERLAKMLRRNPIVRKVKKHFHYIMGVVLLYIGYVIFDDFYSNSDSKRKERYLNAQETAKKRVEALQKLK